MSNNGHANIRITYGDYQGYSADTTPEQAERAFTAKYGYKPRTIVKRPGAVLAGPILSLRGAPFAPKQSPTTHPQPPTKGS